MLELLERHLATIAGLMMFALGAFIAHRQRRIETTQRTAEDNKEEADEKALDLISANQRLIDNLQEELDRIRDHAADRDKQEAAYYRELNRLRNTVFHMQEDFLIFKAGVTILSEQVRALGEVPAWEPPATIEPPKQEN